MNPHPKTAEQLYQEFAARTVENISPWSDQPRPWKDLSFDEKIFWMPLSDAWNVYVPPERGIHLPGAKNLATYGKAKTASEDVN